MSDFKNKSDFRYHDGKFSVDNNPVVFSDDGLPGFHQSQEVGCGTGLSYMLWERYDPEEDAELEWIVQFSTAGRCCMIRCFNWIDLIDLLSTLSPIAMAGIFDECDYASIMKAVKRCG